MKKLNPQWTEIHNSNLNSTSNVLTDIPELQEFDERSAALKQELKKFTEVLVNRPRKDHVLLGHQVATLDKLLRAVIDTRVRQTKNVNTRIVIQGEEAKILTAKELQILQQKDKLEDQMEKETLKRFADIKAAIVKINVIAATNEKNIEALLKKRQGEELKTDKIVAGLLTKETQSKLKRERAEATLNGLEILVKEKTLKKVFIQKQLTKLEAGENKQ